MYDVIIAGASFAGLAVASQLKGCRVLLLDRKPIGSGQTSACGTIARLLEYWGLTEAQLQRHSGFSLHTPTEEINFSSPYSWCTFDYSLFCRRLFERSGAEFIQATVRGFDGDQVWTSQGRYKARFIVDATGWKAALASGIDGRRQSARSGLNLGIETALPLSSEGSLDPALLHFWYDPGILQGGIGWAFPRGEQVSLGVGAYGRSQNLRPALARMARRARSTAADAHGSYFPYRLLNPIAGELFVVGDAAGMCLGLTGEGIRPAMYFGEACGRIIRRGLESGLDRAACHAEFTIFVQTRRSFFNSFTLAQQILTRFPPRIIGWLARLITVDRARRWLFDRYWGLTRAWDDKPGGLAGPPRGNARPLNNTKPEPTGLRTSIEDKAPEVGTP